jgi:DHA2 family multidrug resistance protein
LTLVSHTTPGTQSFQNVINGLSQRLVLSGMSPHEAHAQAYARIYRAVQAQAGTLAYIDTYWVLAVGAAIMFVLSFFLRKNDPRGGGEAAVG